MKKKTRFFSAFLTVSLLTVSIFSPLTVTAEASLEASAGESQLSEEAESLTHTSEPSKESTEEWESGYLDPGYHIEAADEEETLNGEAASPSYALIDVGTYFPALADHFEENPNPLVTPVRNQGSFSLCWSFAAMAGIESNILKTYGGDSYTLDLSELDAAYYAQNRNAANQMEGCEGDTSTLLKSFGQEGGNAVEIITSLSSWRGVVSEETAPYTDLINGTLSTSLTDGTLAHGEKLYYLTDVEMTSGSDKNRIKSLLTQRGALQISIYYSLDYYNSDTHALYNDEQYYSTHDVTIVGWDDDYPRENFKKWDNKENNGQPEENGAWLIKNSHGTMENAGGYFWLSYEDKALSAADVYAYQMTKADSYYQHNYQYDGGKDNAFYNAYTPSFNMANVFTAKGEEDLKAVSFWTFAQDLKYEITIYKNVTDTPTSGELQSQATVSGTLSYGGYHTVSLPSSVPLRSGEKYGVVIKLIKCDDDDDLPIYVVLERTTIGDSDYTSSVQCLPGESFISSDGENWTDATKLSEEEPIYADTGNIRIKAFTDDAPASENLTGQRLAGKNRYETMALIAKEAFPEGADEAILVTGEKFPDGLTASALAGAKNCPILLTRLNGLNQPLITLLKDTWQGRVKKLTLVGAGFSESLKAELQSTCGVEVIEDTAMAGINRYDTANRVCRQGLKDGTFTTDACIIATGNDAADALAMSPWAYYYHMPILLANQGELSRETRELAELFTTVYVAGADPVVHEDAIASLTGNVMRLSGKNRYETSLAIARAFVPANTQNSLLPLHEESFDNTFIFAAGQTENFPDALAGASLSGNIDDSGSPSAIILVKKDSSTPAVNDYLQTLSVSSDHPVKAYFLGAVTEEVQSELLSHFRESR